MSTTMKAVCKWALIAILILAVALAVFIYYSGIWHALYPSSQHDTTPPSIPQTLASPGILVFSKTNGFRHRDGIRGGLEALHAIADTRGWSIYATENGAVFNDRQLHRFATVVFLNATGDMLSKEQQQTFQHWLESGGGWLGIHAAGDGSHRGWSWYLDNLIGAQFTAHTLDPNYQVARVVTENPQHPVNSGMPAEWRHEEEWYSWEQSPRLKGFTILATLDESSYQPVQRLLGKERDLSMGDHPVVWSNCVGKGRSVYTAMGHKAEAFEQPEVRQLLENALAWTITGPC